MALDKFINSVRREVAKRFDLKTDAEIDAFFIGMEESAKDNQEALEKRDKMLRDTVAELAEAKRLLKAAVEDFKTLVLKSTEVCNMKIPCNECPLNCHLHNLGWKKEAEALKLIGETNDEP